WIDAYAAFFTDRKDDAKRRNGLVTALEEISYAYPDEIEAKAFLVFHLWDNKRAGIPMPSRLAVDAIARQVLAVNPTHSGVHHYLIHLWNSGDKDARALTSAAQDGQDAPAIAHLWHMPGHTFSALHRYIEAAWQQEASARVDHAHMAAARIMPEQIHNYAHNNSWLVKNLIYIGRARDAVDLAKNLIELPRLSPGRQQAYDLGREGLLNALEDFSLWDEAAALEETPFLAPEEKPEREARRLHVLGRAWFGRGDRDRAEAKVEALKQLLAGARKERAEAVDRAEAEAEKANKSETEIVKATGQARRKFAPRIKAIQRALNELDLARAELAGDRDAIRKCLDAPHDRSSVRQADLLRELEDFAGAEKLARDAVNADDGQSLPRAMLALVLWQAGKKAEAIEAFNQLRDRSGPLDLNAPPFARLRPIADELHLPSDWRIPFHFPTDAGVHPDLLTLGPMHWGPYPAPEWSLPNAKNEAVSLAEYRGHPVLVAFYLGGGCTHCIAQLNELAPLTGDFENSGIRVVAISTEAPDGLQRTFAAAKDQTGFPFPIVSDHEQDIFRAYRAYDDFEGMPLHGLFLIDAAGQVRWQNISYQPFTELKWLLGEAQRLLAIPVSDPKTAALR
ncbi:MAG: redoxin domain-containing protein, partial [Chthoniobacteraceae bacterium]